MIYVDTSVALSVVFSETRTPPATFWAQSMVSSRLLEYETMNRIHARNGSPQVIRIAQTLLEGIDMADLSPSVLSRLLAPFPIPVRTLDGLHLATMDYLRARGQSIELATYEVRFATSARAMGFSIAQL